MAGKDEVKEKRRPGQLAQDGNWLVLSESKGSKGEGWKHNCGTEVLCQKVTRPVWNGLFPSSGDKKNMTEMIPYCPRCEEVPNSNGPPIMPG